MHFAPFALVRIVLDLSMMSRAPVIFLSVFVAFLLSGAAPSPAGRSGGASPDIEPEDMTVGQLMNALNEANLLARPYYNGVPDPTAVGRGYNEKRRETRSQVLARLSKINIAQVPSNTFDGVALRDAIPVLSLLINRNNNGPAINI